MSASSTLSVATPTHHCLTQWGNVRLLRSHSADYFVVVGERLRWAGMSKSEAVGEFWRLCGFD